MNTSANQTLEALQGELRALYEQSGYAQYKMSKFEEYDLYVRNKDFLISDSVITFTDTNGKLMALKPDVTLSIIKNSGDALAATQKVYYNENVYRISKGTHTFKEILQSGLECMGEIDDYCIYEVLSLACRSLKCIGRPAVLDVSHLGIVAAVLDDFVLPNAVKAQIVKCIDEKNCHEIERICAENGIEKRGAERICSLVQLYGDPLDVIAKLRELFADESDCTALTQLETMMNAFAGTELYEMLRLDFSVVSDMNYYNGFVFKGFVEGVPNSVLSGGQYDRLMQRLHRDFGAIGFALYLDELERLLLSDSGFDVDTVVLYDEGVSLAALSKALEELRKSGKCVCAQRKKPEKLRYAQLMKFENGEVKPLG